MRNSTKKFVDAVTAWFRQEMDKRVDEANASGSHLPHIRSWASGYRSIVSGMDSYPGCILVVDRKVMADPYSVIFDLGIALGVSDDDPDTQEELIHIYADMLEDCVRSDWHLGGVALDVANGWEITYGYVQGVALAMATLSCEVDLGGFVYEKDPGSAPELDLEEPAIDYPESAPEERDE